MSNNRNYIEYLKSCGTIKQGHFVLSSGLHSEYYVQCASLFIDPQRAEELCSDLATKIKETIDISNIDYVVAPAMGGVLIGYEIAKQLGCKSMFCERVSGKFELRRGFNLNKTDNVLVVEDVITTGKSSLETYHCINSFGTNIVAEACLIDRRKAKGSLNGKTIIPLLELDIATFSEDDIPNHLKNIPITKPGSRFLKK